MAMLALCYAVLLMSVQAGYKVGDSNGAKELIEAFVLTAPTCLHSNELLVKHALNKALKLFKVLKHFRLMTNEI
jgi:hypothetical protein